MSKSTGPKSRGRPSRKPIEKIPRTPEQIAKAIFKANDKKLFVPQK